MLYVTETEKNLETAARDLEAAVNRSKFEVLHVHDLQKTLKEKGVHLPNARRIPEVCNPQRANQVLTANMALNMVLPYRISAYQESGNKDWHGPTHGSPQPDPKHSCAEDHRRRGGTGDHADD